MPRVIACLLLLLHIATIWLPSARAATARLLIYSATGQTTFRHDSIPTAIRVLREKGPLIDAIFDATEESSDFNDTNLPNYDALIFLSTTGEVLQSDAAFQQYINNGGNFVGIHSASDTLRNSTVYLRELGSRFGSHPPLQRFTVEILEPTHPSVTMLPRSGWSVVDEPYNFEVDPRSFGAVVVLSANESTYEDGDRRRFNQGSPHPIAWYQERGAGVQPGKMAGRSFYTGLGHQSAFWNDPLFIGHVLGGISWVLQSNTTKAFNSNALVGNPQSSTSTSSRRVPTSTQSGITAKPTPTPSKSSRRKRPSVFRFMACIALTRYYLDIVLFQFAFIT